MHSEPWERITVRCPPNQIEKLEALAADEETEYRNISEAVRAGIDEITG